MGIIIQAIASIITDIYASANTDEMIGGRVGSGSVKITKKSFPLGLSYKICVVGGKELVTKIITAWIIVGGNLIIIMVFSCTSD